MKIKTTTTYTLELAGINGSKIRLSKDEVKLVEPIMDVICKTFKEFTHGKEAESYEYLIKNVNLVSVSDYHGKRKYDKVVKLQVTAGYDNVDSLFRDYACNTSPYYLQHEFIVKLAARISLLSIRPGYRNYDVIGFFTDDDDKTIITIARTK